MNLKSFSISGSQDKPIHIDFFDPENRENSALVIFAHGFKGFKDWGTHDLVGRYFARHGFSFLKFNFSHAGIGSGKGDTFDDLNAFSQNTFSRELFDLDQLITFCQSGKEFTKPDKIFLIGHSLGGAMCIIQASEDKRVDKLATWAAVSNLRHLWTNEQEVQWREDGVMYITNTRTNQQMPLGMAILDDLTHHPERLDILNAARSITQPWLIVHGEADPTVPVEQAEELSRQQELGRLLLIPEADHVFNARHPWNENELPRKLQEVCDSTISFFKE